MKIEEIESKPNFPQLETEILKFWQEHDVFRRLREKIKGGPKWSFLDGPITANNPMGVHTAWGRTYKDVFQRYKAMRGYDQRFQNGFDCQGLWVEVEVEKELGFKTKKDIETFGIGEFVEACKERVRKYSAIQTQQSIRLGQWMDWENSYYTMSDENNYAIWAFLKKCFEKGWLYKGHDVVPWCPRCGTAISQHEILTEEYQELTHNSIYFKARVKGQPNTFFLVWTTTPWTLPADVALAVHPDFSYVKVQSDDAVYILVAEKKDLVPGGVVLETMLGSDLEGVEYEGLFDELPAVRSAMSGKTHHIVLWDEVTAEDGTGIVHIAPGCGEEDFLLGKEKALPVINPTDDENKYPVGFGSLTGTEVTEAEEKVFAAMENKGLVFKIEPFTHRYPTCWRCKSELIFRLVDEWYISMKDLRQKLIDVTKTVTWIPDFGLERELDWLNNMQDWLISKKRYWGLALPIFECGKCNKVDVIGNKKELKEKSVSGWEEFEGHSPHRPWVDEVKIKCSNCGEEVSRIADVGNPWLDAGIVPFSTMGYFSDPSEWEKWFPADLICESFPGQFKNWFYSLLVMSTVLTEKAPMKTVYGYASVRDENGEEMHKSKGNAIWFDEAVDKIGAEPMRWMYVKQKITNNLRFAYRSAEESARSLITLWNCHKFVLDAGGQRPNTSGTVKSIETSLLDDWVLSRLNSTIKTMTKCLEDYDVYSASLTLETFIDDLSVWYIRRSRDRVGMEASGEEAGMFLRVSQEVIKQMTILLAPLVPFYAEKMYQHLDFVGKKESVHLEDWPLAEASLIDEKLEEQMRLVRDLVEAGHAVRKGLGIKVRQPLGLVTFRGPGLSELTNNNDLTEIIRLELNVKEVQVETDAKLESFTAIFDTQLTPELKAEGEARELVRSIQSLRKEHGLHVGEKITVSLPAWPKAYEEYIKSKTSATSLSVGPSLTIEP